MQIGKTGLEPPGPIDEEGLKHDYHNFFDTALEKSVLD